MPLITVLERQVQSQPKLLVETLSKKESLDWRDGLLVKHSCCSCRESIPSTYGNTQLTNPSPGDPAEPSRGLWAPAHTWYTYTQSLAFGEVEKYPFQKSDDSWVLGHKVVILTLDVEAEELVQVQGQLEPFVSSRTT